MRLLRSISWTFFFLVLSAACSKSSEPVFGVDLERSLSALEHAESHEEWEASPDHPIQVFQRFESVGFNADDNKDLCAQLKAMKDSDLSVFAEAIAGRGNKLDLGCRHELESRLGFYAKHMEMQMQTAKLETSKSVPLTSFQLPMQVRVIDPSVDHTIITADLKPGQFALTFDDGPHRSLTPRLLEILAEHRILASFFVVGNSSQRLPEIVLQAYLEGHSIGTHSWSHPQLSKLSAEMAAKEINSAQNLVSQITGEKISFFRFPYGSSSQMLRNFITHNSWTSFLWNVDSLDWKIRDPSVLLKKVLFDMQQTQRGVVLFHDIQPQTIAMMPNLLMEMAKRKYEIVLLWPRARAESAAQQSRLK